MWKTIARGFLRTPPPFRLAKILRQSNVFMYPNPPIFWVKGLLSPPHKTLYLDKCCPCVQDMALVGQF